MLNNQIQLVAAREAFRKHLELKTDRSKQIDIFQIISECKIPLNFQPLKGLSGVFIPSVPLENSVAGILINENHPRSRQRYTAAHEFCHYIRDNQLSLDFETEIIARDEFNKVQEMERIAEAFAAWFLMPKELVESQCNSLNIDLNNLDYVCAYQLSLALGTSYPATVNHLLTLKKITREKRDFLTKKHPKEIKNEIIKGSYNIGWNDVWLINESRNNEIIYPQVGDEVRLRLKETPSTGYLWKCDYIDLDNLELRENLYNIDDIKSIGAEGCRNINLIIKQEGKSTVSFILVRPWLMETENDETFNLTISVEGKMHGINIAALH